MTRACTRSGRMARACGPGSVPLLYCRYAVEIYQLHEPCAAAPTLVLRLYPRRQQLSKHHQMISSARGAITIGPLDLRTHRELLGVFCRWAAGARCPWRETSEGVSHREDRGATSVTSLHAGRTIKTICRRGAISTGSTVHHSSRVRQNDDHREFLACTSRWAAGARRPWRETSRGSKGGPPPGGAAASSPPPRCLTRSPS
jgi:hypothetical protein